MITQLCRGLLARERAVPFEQREQQPLIDLHRSCGQAFLSPVDR
jgi:hypothetical protein